MKNTGISINEKTQREFRAKDTKNSVTCCAAPPL